MTLSLEAGIDRRGTQCLKWDTTPEGVLPMWVADMDFPCAPGILEALRKRLEHPVFGYTRMSDADKQAIIDYYARRHGLKLCGEEMLFTPGVVDSLLLSVHALTAPGDKVLIQSPVYGPFSGVIRRPSARSWKIPSCRPRPAGTRWTLRTWTRALRSASSCSCARRTIPAAASGSARRCRPCWTCARSTACP